MGGSPEYDSTITADFLLNDLDLAVAFMDTAQVSGEPETVTRYHQNAAKVYDLVLRYLSERSFAACERTDIESKLAALKARLAAVGLRFSLP